MLAQVTGGFEKARNAAVHHYHKSFRGVSAMLIPEQAHKLSIGAPVQSTILNSLNNQVILGGASKARLSVYKACWFNKFICADLLKAYDDAILDNVDVTSLSAGQNSSVNYFEDCNAIGAYKAFRSNIVVVASAGKISLTAMASLLMKVALPMLLLG
ncbi:hypothetical protein QYF36_011103 [Acer negundo]|nr:hypothetical protein QYF36_011103 [Acer negundo]